MTDIDPLSADFAAKFPDSFARTIARGNADDISRVLGRLPPHSKASIVACLPGTRIAQLLDSGGHDPQQWLLDAPFDDAIMLLSRITRERRLALVNTLGNRERRMRLLRHQQYPAHSVGALVGDVLRRIRVDSRAADVLAELREHDGDDPGRLILVDSEGRYVGLLNLWQLVAREPPAGLIREYVRDVAPISPETSIATAARDSRWNSHNWLPVVDHRQRVLGGVSRENVFRAATDHASSAHGADDILFELLTGLAYVGGALLDVVLARRNAR